MTTTASSTASVTRSMRPARGAAAAAFAVALPLMSWAEAAAGADVEAGRQKAQVCFACHGPAGNWTNPVMPSLEDQHAAFIRSALDQLREGKRPHAAVKQIAQ